MSLAGLAPVPSGLEPGVLGPQPRLLARQAQQEHLAQLVELLVQELVLVQVPALERPVQVLPRLLFLRRPHCSILQKQRSQRLQVLLVTSQDSDRLRASRLVPGPLFG